MTLCPPARPEPCSTAPEVHVAQDETLFRSHSGKRQGRARSAGCCVSGCPQATPTGFLSARTRYGGFTPTLQTVAHGRHRELRSLATAFRMTGSWCGTSMPWPGLRGPEQRDVCRGPHSAQRAHRAAGDKGQAGYSPLLLLINPTIASTLGLLSPWKNRNDKPSSGSWTTTSSAEK